MLKSSNEKFRVTLLQDCKEKRGDVSGQNQNLLFPIINTLKRI
jgi:hypothetical protein